MVNLLCVKKGFTSGISVSKSTVKKLQMTNAPDVTTQQPIKRGKVNAMVINDRRITIREVADNVGISIGSYHEIVSDVSCMKHLAAKFVRKLLNF